MMIRRRRIQGTIGPLALMFLLLVLFFLQSYFFCGNKNDFNENPLGKIRDSRVIGGKKGCFETSDGDSLCFTNDGDTCPLKVTFSDDAEEFRILQHGFTFDKCHGPIFSEVLFGDKGSKNRQGKGVLRFVQNAMCSHVVTSKPHLYYTLSPSADPEYCFQYRPQISNATMCPLDPKKRVPWDGKTVVFGKDVGFVGVQCGEYINFHVRHVHNESVQRRKMARVSEVFKPFNRHYGKDNGIRNHGPPNIVILIVDTLSRNSFRRQSVWIDKLLKEVGGLDVITGYIEANEPEFYATCNKCREDLGPFIRPNIPLDDTPFALSFDPSVTTWFDMKKASVIGLNTQPTLKSFIGGMPPEEFPGIEKSYETSGNLIDFFNSLGYVTAFSGFDPKHIEYENVEHDYMHSFLIDNGFLDHGWTRFPRSGGMCAS
eukprot:TRINITY_DN1226_c0_g1_i1.p1 TRINITY_DN1226_c0_g1~~TRINITY_DN1226_c0_g1_i1.p1  ORF type:complete len:428 (+),score=64.24 TRINITY_DN1226_c0_g1_i1:102-1385(+)